MSGRRLAKIVLISAMAALAGGLAGCSTVKMPNLDKFKLSGFFNDENKIDDYPKVSDAPSAPTDIRSDAAWDTDAKNLIKKRDAFNDLGGNGVAISDAEFERDLEALKAKVRAYKADDPQ